MIYSFERGETIEIPLRLVDGDRGLVSAITATLKKAGPNESVPSQTAPSVATFTVADSDTGWIFTIPASTSATLTPRSYVANAILTVSGKKIVTDPVIVRIKPST